MRDPMGCSGILQQLAVYTGFCRLFANIFQVPAKILKDFCRDFNGLVRFSTILSFQELDRDMKYLARSHKIFQGGSG